VTVFARATLGILGVVLWCGCGGSGPAVTVSPGAALGGRSLVVWDFPDALSAQHSMVFIMGQELVRRGLAVKLSLEQGETLPDDALVLRLEQARAGDQAMDSSVKNDLADLDLRLRDASGTELARASYSGLPLDKIEQRALARDIAAGWFP